MPSMRLRRKATYEVSGNVIWVAIPRSNRGSRGRDLSALLAQRVAQLGREIERSRQLQCEIAAASTARRYEVFTLGSASQARSFGWALANAQRAHLDSLLRFVNALARGQSERRIRARTQTDQIDSLAKSIRDLQLSMKRARELTQGLLVHCRRGNRTGEDPPAEGPPAGVPPRGHSKTAVLAEFRRIENQSAR